MSGGYAAVGAGQHAPWGGPWEPAVLLMDGTMCTDIKSTCFAHPGSVWRYEQHNQLQRWTTSLQGDANAYFANIHPSISPLPIRVTVHPECQEKKPCNNIYFWLEAKKNFHGGTRTWKDWRSSFQASASSTVVVKQRKLMVCGKLFKKVNHRSLRRQKRWRGNQNCAEWTCHFWRMSLADCRQNSSWQWRLSGV